MIRINLLGQAKPRGSRRPVDTGAALPILFIGAGVLFGCLILGYLYYSWQRQLNDANQTASGSIRKAESRLATAGIDHRAIAAGSYGWSGVAG